MWTRSALPLTIVLACVATLGGAVTKIRSRAAADSGRTSRPGRRHRARRRRSARGIRNRRRRTDRLRGPVRQLSRPERRRRRRWSGAGRRTGHARDPAAVEDGRKLLAAGDDRVGLRESSDAVRSAWRLEARRGLCGRRVHPESERHRRRRRGDECQDVARGEDAESRRVRRRSASRRRTDEETEAVERTLSRPVSSDESDADPQPACRGDYCLDISRSSNAVISRTMAS